MKRFATRTMECLAGLTIGVALAGVAILLLVGDPGALTVRYAGY